MQCHHGVNFSHMSLSFLLLLGLLASGLNFLFRRKVPARLASNQSKEPTAPLQNKFSEIATDPARGLSLSRQGL